VNWVGKVDENIDQCQKLLRVGFNKISALEYEYAVDHCFWRAVRTGCSYRNAGQCVTRVYGRVHEPK